MTPPKGCELSRLPFLRTWIRTRCAIVLHLSCGIIQVCNPDDPGKMNREYGLAEMK